MLGKMLEKTTNTTLYINKNKKLYYLFESCPDTANNDGGDWLNSRVYFTPSGSGTYFIAAGADAAHTGTYRLSVQEIVDDYPAAAGSAGTVAVGAPATSAVDYAGDEDWFAVELIAGRRYEIDLEGWWTGQGTLVDPYLRGIHDAAGHLIAGTGDDDGDDYPASAAGATGTVAVGAPAAGAVDYAGDEDWFAVELVAGRDYRIDLEGSPTDRGTLADPFLYGIHDSDGNLLADAANDEGGTGYNSRLEFTAPGSGTYYIAAGAYGEDIGTYIVEVMDVR